MKRKTTVKPTAGKFAFLAPIYNSFRRILVPQLARDTGVGKQWRLAGSLAAVTGESRHRGPAPLQAGQKVLILRDRNGISNGQPSNNHNGHRLPISGNDVCINPVTR